MKHPNPTLADFKNTACAHLNPHLFVKAEVKKKSKYNNVKVEFDGKNFDSIKERDRYITLRYLEGMQEITELNCQVTFRLESNDEKICDYVADFTYKKNGELTVEDVKSSITKRLRPYLMKKKMMLAQYKLEIKEV